MENVLISIPKWKQKSKWKFLAIGSQKSNHMINDKSVDQNTKNNHANMIQLNEDRTNKMQIYRLIKTGRKV